jgi:peptidoglycan/xylan/chitin deacetylase (PgdA/CDA1 family)
MFYLVRSPWWLKRLHPGRVWEMAGKAKSIYLSFDDGPDAAITPFVLDELAKYDAKATFFCIGKNRMQCPKLYDRILAEGHAVGNHSFDHLDGWKTKTAVYVDNILKARQDIESDLFRPPYGKLTRRQQKQLSEHGFKTIMWSVLSGDFDETISPQQCCSNVIKNAASGTIIVFHDSKKANKKMSYALPLVLKYFSEKGYRFDKIILE